MPQKYKITLLAGGCFWGMQDLFRKLPGVIKTRVGYAGGETPDPTYEQVSGGRTGHAEAIQISYDPSRISYSEVLEFFFRIHDPTTPNRQGNDIGTQYRSVIFAADDEQKRRAEEAIKAAEKSGRWKDPVATQILGPMPFYEAEDYHQDYLETHPGGYSCHWVRE